MSNKVICVGEALIDRLQSPCKNNFIDYLGGAPANVCFALKKLNINSAFIGTLGDDIHGKRFIAEFKDQEIDTSFLKIDQYSSTRIVKVLRDDTGDRYFAGFEKMETNFFADALSDKSFLFNREQELNHLLNTTKFIVTGTILLSSSNSENFINSFLEYVQKFKLRIVIDLNWRQVFWDHSNDSKLLSNLHRIDKVKTFLEFANILKLAKEEAILFFDNCNPKQISNELSNKPDVIITDGPNPVSWFINGFEGKSHISHSEKIVDTTGAGDAFLAGFISKCFKCSNSFSQIEKNINFAIACGLLTCLNEGAIDSQPNLQEVSQFLSNLES